MIPSTPNWYPDPWGRFDFRFFDGSQWTAQTSRNGTVYNDPNIGPVAPVPMPQHVHIHQPPQKSAGVAALLAFLFGPFGMFYSTVTGALVMLVLYVITLPVFLVWFLLWPACMIWAAAAVDR